jgi:hypothetical protein
VDTVVRSLQFGVTPLAAIALSRGIADFTDDLADIWSEASDEGVVRGTLEDAEREAFVAVAGRFAGITEQRREAAKTTPRSSVRNAASFYSKSLTADELSDLEAMLETDGVLYLLTLLGEQDEAYLSALLESYRYAAANRLSIPDYVKRLHRVADRFGAAPDATGDLYRTWLAFSVEEPLEQRAAIAAGNTLAGRSAFPYLEQVTAADDVVRVNHFALHGFTAMTNWEGWELEVLPPLGWGCRCRPRRVSWQEARDRGLIDVMSEVSAAMLARFRSLGGADDDFPRHRFVLPAN